ncbi:MAG: prolipoprotein diacylglyceryl transferase [Spirochaetales bacterium]|jgi:phosphatidylglycerol:prolipoprotein diacylglycerol transferase|nr:prolipoprotein diacylglyceryl transferase [Spirochaetales bacterium]
MPLLALPYPSWLKPEIIPGLPFRWYGLMYLVAFGIAYWLFNYQIKEKKIPISRETSSSLFFWTILGLLLGARILSALVYNYDIARPNPYLQNPLLIFWPFDAQGRFTGLQGMSYHGGLLGAVAAVVLYCRKKGLSVREVGDLLTAGIPLGYTFGRLGNFINGELYGRATAAPWGIIFPHAEKFPARLPWVQTLAQEASLPLPAAENALINLPRHPSQLYEAFFEGIFLWLVLWFLLKNRSRIKGFLLGAYIAGYGLVRFFIEYFREPDKNIGFPLQLSSQENPIHIFVSPWNFTTGQIFCLLMVLAGLLLILIFSRIDKAEKEKLQKSSPQKRKKFKP